MMVSARRSKRYTPIGVDIKDSAVYAVQYGRAEGQPKLHAAAWRRIEAADPPQTQEAATISALRSLLASEPFVGRRAVGAAPRTEVDMRRIKLSAGIGPEDGARFVEELVQRARGALLYPPEEAVLDYLPIGDEMQDGRRFLTVLLIASKKQSVLRHLELLKGAGLECVHLDVAPCAAVRMMPEKKTTYAVIELGRRCTVISVAQGSKLLFSRTVKQGMERMIEELAMGLDVPFEEGEALMRTYGIRHNHRTRCDLNQAQETGLIDPEIISATLFEICCRRFEQFVKEVQRSIDYVSHQNHAIFGRGPWMGGEVEKVYLVGELIPKGVEPYLSDALEMEVIVAGAFGGPGDREPGTVEGDEGFTVAAGLALGERAR